MSSRKNNELFEAICFFGKKSIVKEMRYSEFEAVLDGVVGITELANKEVSAAYVKITPQLRVHSLVCFEIEFNQSGFADEDWNIPLRHLADSAGPGPDLGGGPVRLACKSQCAVSWYQKELWEPNSSGLDHFQMVKDALKRNKLGLIASSDDEADYPPLMDQLVDVPLMSDKIDLSEMEVSNQKLINQKLANQAQEFQQKVDLLIERQKKTLHGLDEKYRDEIDQVKRATRNETQSYRQVAHDLEQQANQNKVLLEKLQSKNTRLEREYLQLQDDSEANKSQYGELKDEYLELLRNQRSSDEGRSQKVIELKEQLTLKMVSIDELEEQLTITNAQINELSNIVASHQEPTERKNQSTEINELKQQVDEKQAENISLKAKMSTLEGELKRINSQFVVMKEDTSSANAATQRTELANSEMNKKLKETEFKALELEQKVNSLRTANQALKEELTESEESAGDESGLYERMEKLELVFVAYHPGAGHISLPARQLQDYLDKPMVFAAQKCSVTLEHYKSWLLHYDNHECQECGVPVKRVDAPSDYQPGINDRCSKHRVDGQNVAMFRKTS